MLIRNFSNQELGLPVSRLRELIRDNDNHRAIRAMMAVSVIGSIELFEDIKYHDFILNLYPSQKYPIEDIYLSELCLRFWGSGLQNGVTHPGCACDKFVMEFSPSKRLYKTFSGRKLSLNGVNSMKTVRLIDRLYDYVKDDMKVNCRHLQEKPKLGVYGVSGFIPYVLLLALVIMRRRDALNTSLLLDRHMTLEYRWEYGWMSECLQGWLDAIHFELEGAFGIHSPSLITGRAVLTAMKGDFSARNAAVLALIERIEHDYPISIDCLVDLILLFPKL